jgi:hypothetical protein
MEDGDGSGEYPRPSVRTAQAGDFVPRSSYREAVMRPDGICQLYLNVDTLFTDTHQV